jgi:hypothetical protein
VSSSAREERSAGRWVGVYGVSALWVVVGVILYICASLRAISSSWDSRLSIRALSNLRVRCLSLSEEKRLNTLSSFLISFFMPLSDDNPYQPREVYSERHTIPVELVRDDAERNRFHFVERRADIIPKDDYVWTFLVFEKPTETPR